jgi:hypothetical protein
MSTPDAVCVNDFWLFGYGYVELTVLIQPAESHIAVSSGSHHHTMVKESFSRTVQKYSPSQIEECQAP